MLRSTIIKSSWIGRKIPVYSGRTWKVLTINSAMVGRRLGEFVFTRSMKKR